jgi:polysaccharide export outer membrane protein
LSSGVLAQESDPAHQAPQAQQSALPPGDPAKRPVQAPEATDPAKLAASQAQVPANDSVYLIGPEDVLVITVWGDQRIGGQVLVRPDGRISLNLVGEVMANSKTPEQLSKDIEEVLKTKDILKRPQVNVQVQKIESKKYSINGEVLKPGQFPLVVQTKVFDALVNAGGFKDFANKSKIQIIRGTQRFHFNWNEVIKGKKTEQNIQLLPGDIIIVP